MQRLPIGDLSTEKQIFNLRDGGIIDYYHQFLSKEEADFLWEVCRVGGSGQLNWSQGEKDGLSYTYNAKTNISIRWPAEIESVKRRIELATGQTYNVVLMNWYNDGSHHVSWHSDSETDLVKPSVIASLSLGATRPFQLRHKDDSKKGTDKSALCMKMKENPDYVPTEEEAALLSYQTGVDPDMNKEIICHHGDLLVMRGNLQENWRHRVPQTSRPEDIGPRICFTFRSVISL